MAPGLLKAVLADHGIGSIAIDLNVDIHNQLECHPRKKQILDFFYTQAVDPTVVDDIADMIERLSDRLLAYRPDLIALSLLAYTCQIFTGWLCISLKQKNPSVKIVIGGSGIRRFVGDSDSIFCDEMRALSLIDDYISGPGEISFPEYVKGNLAHPGINSPEWQLTPDLNLIPHPDYDDYDLMQYHSPTIPIFDSQGCVRNCEFCDIIEYQKKFQYRHADVIFQEMLHQVERYGNLRFSFRNSLTNGNLKEFRKLMDLISDYNITHPEHQQITWSGYFIVRQPSQHPPELWEKISQSRGTLVIGVESVINRVRMSIGKTFTDSDIDYHLEMGKKYGVKMVLLIIAGYPTETLEDYEFTKRWFVKRRQYAKDPIININLSPASVLPNTQLARKADEYGLKVGTLPTIWINQQLNISQELREKYQKELYEILVKCGYNIRPSDTTKRKVDELH